MNATAQPGNSTIVKPILGKYFVRAMASCDLYAVEQIEKTGDTYWRCEDFQRILKEPGMQGRVITIERQIIGHFLFQLSDDDVQIWTITIYPGYRRRKIASEIIKNLFRDHVQNRRDRLTCYVRESNLDAQLFLRNNGMEAKFVEPDYFIDHDINDVPHHEDAYYFVRKTNDLLRTDAVAVGAQV